MGRKLRVKANELTDTDVSFVSLVKRGANRIPIRVTKSDDGEDQMLDLTGHFRKADAKARAAKAEADAVAARKAEELANARRMLEDAGFVVTEKNDKTTTGQPTYFDPSADAAAGGNSMTDTQQADEGGAADADEVNAKKKRQAIETASNTTRTNDNGPVAKGAKPPFAEGKDSEAAEGAADDEAAEGEDKKDCQKAEAGAESAVKPEVQKAETPDFQAVLKDALGPIVASIAKLDAVATKLTALEASVNALGGRVEKAEEVAQGAVKAVKGTIAGVPAGDRSTTVTKTASDNAPPLLDTGMARFMASR